MALFGVGLVGLILCFFGVSEEASGSPIIIRRGIIPGLASDSARGAPTALPATATSGPALAPQLVVRIDMVANELAYAEGSPIVPVQFRALIEGAVPDAGALTYISGAVIDAHPPDLCSWTPEFVNSTLTMTALRRITLLPPKQEVVLNFDGPVWHFAVECPGKELRVPAFAEESLTGWLGLILGTGGPREMAIETPAYSGSPSCLHNRGVAHGTSQWGTVTITADIVSPPCTPPPLP